MLKLKLRQLYLEGKLPNRYHDYEDNWDSLPSEMDLFPDKDW